MKKVLFVCMGNICRSPTAEAVFRKLVQQNNQANDWLIDSAGTHATTLAKSRTNALGKQHDNEPIT